MKRVKSKIKAEVNWSEQTGVHGGLFSRVLGSWSFQWFPWRLPAAQAAAETSPEIPGDLLQSESDESRTARAVCSLLRCQG